jgi:hypothetical protein
MGPKHQGPSGAPPPAAARVRAPAPKTGGQIGTANTTLPTKTTPAPPPPSPKTAPTPPLKATTYGKAPRTVPPKVTTYDKAPRTEPPASLTTLYNNTVKLNHKLSNDVDALKKEMKTHQNNHDRSMVCLHSQIQDLTKKLKTTTKARQDVYDHYQKWKTTWLTQIADQDKTIQAQKRDLDGLANSLEVMVKRQRT